MPFAYVDLDLLDDNIRRIAANHHGKRIRVASKSVRSVPVMRRIFASDPCFQGVMAYTAAEALYLVEQGFDDILLGYPVWHPALIADLLRFVGEGRTITFMIDCPEHLEHLAAIGRDAGIIVPVCIDIDMSIDVPRLHFGVRRSPITTAQQAEPLLHLIANSPQLRLDGIMGYEAQVAGVGDHVPGQGAKNVIVRALKRRSVRAAAERRQGLVRLIGGVGLPLRFVNGGGTGSMHTTGQEPWVTEITVGSGFYSPGLFDNYRDFRYHPAAGFAIEVVRRPRPDIVTCAGGGYIASGAAGADRLPKPHLPEGLALLPLEGAGEVQTPLTVPPGVELNLGDPVFLRHSKAGEVCERFPCLHALQRSDGRLTIVDQLATYRGDGQCFL